MANIETNVKKYITSLLTSTPLVVTIQQLNKDYRNTIGEAIPYQKLGYNSLEHLLHCIPDTVQVRGTGPTAVVTPVISEKSAHVNQLVTSQKVTVKKNVPRFFSQKRPKNFFPQGYSYPIQKPKPVEYAPPQLPTKKMQYPIKRDISPVTKPLTPSVPTYSSTFQTAKSPIYKNDSIHLPVTKSLSPSVPTPNSSNQPAKSPIYNNELVHNNSISPYRYNATKDYNRPLKETNLLSSTKQQVDSNRLEKNENSTFLTAHAKRIKSKTAGHDLDKISEDQIENSVPLQIRNNLRTLIKSCPKGIWCAEVPEKYRKMFRTELNYQELGFKSLIHLCVCLSSIFHYVRPSMDDYKLYDRSCPLPECAEKHFTMASYGSNYGKAEADCGSALPSLDWSDVKKFLPPDIFMPGREIPRTFLSHDVKENDTIDVIIGEIYDLSKFWVYTTDPQLDQLMDEMQDFYKENAQEYAIPDHLIKEGIYCVQVIFGEYHRALVVDTMPELENTIRVVFIDYGSMTKVSTSGLCFLLDRFGKLEAQAIRCRLANVFPLEEGVPWTKEACRAFRKMVNDRDLTAKINYINWDDQYMEVYLADVTEEDNIFYINDRLVEEGYAQQPGKVITTSPKKSVKAQNKRQLLLKLIADHRSART